MAPWARLLANVIISGGSVVFRSFIRAYEQVVAQGGVNEQAMKTMRDKAMQRMSPDEARKILGITGTLDFEEIKERHFRIFENNDANQGGSYYLQCKVEHAKMSLEEELAEESGEQSTETPEDKPPEQGSA